MYLPVISNFNGVSLRGASFLEHPPSILRTCGCLSLLKRPLLHERDKQLKRLQVNCFPVFYNQFGKNMMEKDGFAAGITTVLITLTATTWKERANAKAISQEMEELVNLHQQPNVRVTRTAMRVLAVQTKNAFVKEKLLEVAGRIVESSSRARKVKTTVGSVKFAWSILYSLIGVLL